MSTHDRLAARRSRVAASWLVGVVATLVVRRGAFILRPVLRTFRFFTVG